MANVKIQRLSTDTTRMGQEIQELKCENQLLHKINGNLLDRVLKLETNDRKLNLVIDGIKEQYNETEDSLYREIVTILNSMYSFNNKANEVDIWKCYRLGAFNRHRSRTVVMEFGNIRDVEFILKV